MRATIIIIAAVFSLITISCEKEEFKINETPQRVIEDMHQEAIIYQHFDAVPYKEEKKYQYGGQDGNIR